MTDYGPLGDITNWVLVPAKRLKELMAAEEDRDQLLKTLREVTIASRSGDIARVDESMANLETLLDEMQARLRGGS